MRRPATAIVGAGKLARALLPGLAAAGYPLVGVASRRIGAARAACRGLRGVRATTSPVVAADGAELLLLAVPDRALREVAEKLARRKSTAWSSRVVLHHAGALGPQALRALADRGAAVGVLHPLQCLGSSPAAAGLLRGSRARIEGDPAALRVARRLARDLGLVPLKLAPSLTTSDRAAYHAAAALLSNDLLALFATGQGLLESAGASAGDARAALLALARGTLTQVEARGLAGALTGPLVRGDLTTVRAHLERLAEVSREDFELHRWLSLRLLRVIAEEGEPPPPTTAARLRRLTPGSSARRRSDV